MLISHARDGRPNSAANSLPTPIWQGIAAANSAAGRLEEIVSKPLMLTHLWVSDGRFSAVKTRFFPASREMPAGSGLARSRLGLLGRQPAIDHQPRPGHESGIVGGEKDDALGDVVGHAEPADRVGRQGEPTRRVDIVGAEIAGAADKGLMLEPIPQTSAA
jgi:hypothetical protein